MNLWAYKYVISSLQEPLSISWSLQHREEHKLPWPQTTLKKNTLFPQPWYFSWNKEKKTQPQSKKYHIHLHFAFFTHNWHKTEQKSNYISKNKSPLELPYTFSKTAKEFQYRSGPSPTSNTFWCPKDHGISKGQIIHQCPLLKCILQYC